MRVAKCLWSWLPSRGVQTPGTVRVTPFWASSSILLPPQGALQGRTFLPAQMYPEPDILELIQQHLPCFLTPVSQVFDINVICQGVCSYLHQQEHTIRPTLLQNLPFSSNYRSNNFKPQTANFSTSTMRLGLHNPPPNPFSPTTGQGNHRELISVRLYSLYFSLTQSNCRDNYTVCLADPDYWDGAMPNGQASRSKRISNH